MSETTRFRTRDDGDEDVEEDELEGDVPEDAEEHVPLLRRHVHNVAPEHLCIRAIRLILPGPQLWLILSQGPGEGRGRGQCAR